MRRGALFALAIVIVVALVGFLGTRAMNNPPEVAAQQQGTNPIPNPKKPLPAGGDGPSATAVATSTPMAATPAATVVPQASACLSWTQFQTMANGLDPYQLITLLDGRPEKVDHNQGGFTLTPGTYILWTGLYVNDTSLGGTTTQFRVDGKTGVWIVNTSQNLVVPTPGGTICLTGFGTTTAPAPAPQPVASCIDAARVVSIINSNKVSNPNGIYIQLDELVNQNPTARLRANGPVNYSVQNAKALFWVRNGNIAGNVLALDTTEGKTLYLATSDGSVNLTFAHSGVQVCGPINPVNDFPWWGKN